MHIKTEDKQSLIVDLPKVVKGLMNFYQDSGTGQSCIFKINAIPESANSMYRYTREGVHSSDGKNKFERAVFADVLHQKVKFNPTGLFAAIVLVQSDSWLSLNGHVMRMDIDNRIKTLMDSVQKSMDLRDEYMWHVHAFKIPSSLNQTIVALYDIGTAIDFYRS